MQFGMTTTYHAGLAIKLHVTEQTSCGMVVHMQESCGKVRGGSRIVLRKDRTQGLLLESEKSCVEELKIFEVVINHVVEFQFLREKKMR